jgi:hypothetical protein
MRPGKMIWHLNTVHPEYQNKPLEFFERKAAEQQRQTQFLTKHTQMTEKLLKASFEVALLIARTNKAHIVGENLVLPAAVEDCEIVHGNKIAETLRSIPASKDTIKRRIDCVGDNIKPQLIHRIKQSNTFAVQLDESTGIANYVQLMVFVIYQYNFQIHEDLLFRKPLSGTTKVFKKVNEFFSENELIWSKCMHGWCSSHDWKDFGIESSLEKSMPRCEI